MKKKLIKLQDNSYSPYSKVKVTSIVVSNKGKEYNGVNVENAAYPSSLCAERVAMFSAIAAGEKIKSFKEIHISSNMKGTLYPCGSCLQVMTELLGSECKVVLHSGNETIETTVNELLPNGISKESFGWK